MSNSITKEEAVELRRRAIERAEELKISKTVLYLLKTDPSITHYPGGEDSLQHNVSRPLPGSGLIMFGDFEEPQVHTLSLASADNATDRVFVYHKNFSTEKITVFKDGPWVQLLHGAAEALRYELKNKDVISILRDFAPITEAHKP